MADERGQAIPIVPALGDASMQIECCELEVGLAPEDKYIASCSSWMEKGRMDIVYNVLAITILLHTCVHYTYQLISLPHFY